PMSTPSVFLHFTAPATPDIYTLSLHDALPTSRRPRPTRSRAGRRRPPPGVGRQGRRRSIARRRHGRRAGGATVRARAPRAGQRRSEEHTSELQSPYDLVCRLLLEKKKKKQHTR